MFRGWRRRLRRADDHILITSRHSEVRLDLETLGISLLAVHPRDERRRIICACNVGEGIPTADAGIQINDAESLLAGEKVAIENADVTQILYDQLSEIF